VRCRAANASTQMPKFPLRSAAGQSQRGKFLTILRRLFGAYPNQLSTAGTAEGRHTEEEPMLTEG